MITRFALLRHDVPEGFDRGGHWDLLLEQGEVCWTWAIEELPGRLVGGDEPATVEARRLADHRKHYLEYEGPVSGGRGTVRRELTGRCEWKEASDRRIEVRLSLRSTAIDLVLERVAGERWQITAW